ncbi:hypothetical protein QJS04_geneDACA019600 [Acorus gramineus]|uniref:Oxidative stress 3 n=1 Tax=Acorus gramineus TaxID=55184 RepID=A0AAV9ACF8_ACOGR|nr:hypothetical protein QJS04_geneDACA019600 [Acorus gramineus]
MDVSLHLQSNHGTMVDEVDDHDEDIGSPSSDGFSSDESDDITGDDAGPLFEMSSLMQQLPLKRGLSKHYQGKSQSFTSLSSVGCLKDLAKPENPCKKRLKSCKSYGGGLDVQRSHSPKASISKRGSSKGGSPSSFNPKRTSVSSWPSRPPIHPHRIGRQTAALFA